MNTSITTTSMSTTGNIVPLRSSSRHSSANNGHQNRRYVITPVGWTVISLTSASALAYPWTHWHELLVTAVTGILMLVSSVALSLSPSRCQVTLKPESRQLAIQDVGRIVLTASNPHQINTLATEAIVTIDNRQYHCAIPSLLKNAAHRAAIDIVPQRRGLIHAGPILLRSEDPMGLLHRFRSISAHATITVSPRTIPLPPLIHDRDSDGLDTRITGIGSDDFHDLRAYSQGDDPRHMHWKATARTGQLITRQYVTGNSPATVLILDSETSHYRDEDEFELAVSVLASIGAAMLMQQREHPVIICTSNSIRNTISRHDDSVALLEACAAIPRYDDAQTQHATAENVINQHVSSSDHAYAISDSNDHSPIMLITGGGHPPIPVLRETILQRMPMNGTMNNIVIIDHETSSSLSVQATTRIIRLSTLKDLPDLLQGWLS